MYRVRHGDGQGAAVTYQHCLGTRMDSQAHQDLPIPSGKAELQQGGPPSDSDVHCMQY